MIQKYLLIKLLKYGFITKKLCEITESIFLILNKFYFQIFTSLKKIQYNYRIFLYLNYTFSYLYLVIYDLNLIHLIRK